MKVEKVALYLLVTIGLASCGKQTLPQTASAPNTSPTNNIVHEDSKVVARIINGVIYNTDGKKISEQSINKDYLAGLTEEEIKKAIYVEIIPMDKLNSNSINDLNSDNAGGSKLSSQSYCVFDLNYNGKCDNFIDSEVIAKRDYYNNYRTTLFEDAKQSCWNTSSSYCEFGLKQSQSGSVKGSISGKWVFPAKQEIGANVETSYTWSTEFNSTTRVARGGCAQYRVTLSNTEYRGYYRAPFYEITNVWGAKTSIGTYNIPNERWNAIVPSAYVNRGWFGC